MHRHSFASQLIAAQNLCALVNAVSFDPSDVHVDEDVPTGSAQVCLKGNTEVAMAYTVQVRSQPSGENPATGERLGVKFVCLFMRTCHSNAAGVDYIIDPADLTLMFPAGEPVERCIPIRIVNDTITSEDEETFIFVLDMLPEGVVPGENPEADVTIIDDDRDGITHFTIYVSTLTYCR